MSETNKTTGKRDDKKAKNDLKHFLFVKNLKFFQDKLNLPDTEFVNAIGISYNSYQNYKKNGNTACPHSKTLDEIASKINNYQCVYPYHISAKALIEKDLSNPTNDTLYYNKFAGTYICYYANNEKHIQYGVLKLFQDKTSNKFNTYGIFSLKDYDKLFEIYTVMDDIKEIIYFPKSRKKLPSNLFEGESSISSSIVWSSLSNDVDSEHISISFDINEKILTKNEHKKFIGARGIALSQTGGHDSKTITFPIILIKSNEPINTKELMQFLNFSNREIPDNDFKGITSKWARLFESIPIDDFTKDEKETMAASLLKVEVSNIIKQSISNFHYYTSEETIDFYDKIIRPIRTKEGTSSTNITEITD